MKKKNSITPTYIFPASFTYANALCGFASIFFSFNNDFRNASVFIIIAILLDIFDGRIARFFKSTSEFGKELDSFADLISFGVAPAILIYLSELYVFRTTGILISFLLVLGGMSRLARYNIININKYFFGIPIDASGMFIAGLVFSNITISAHLIAFCVILLSLLMVCNIKYPSFKKMKENENKKIKWLVFLFIVICILTAVVDAKNLFIIPPGFYILFGPILEMKNKKAKENGKSN